MNINQIKKDFPIYNQKINGMIPIYMDSACVTLKPNQVIKAINKYYKEFPACAGRSGHTYGRKVTEEINHARKIMQDFIRAKRKEEIVFTRNTTEGINLIANSLNLKSGDTVLTSDKEHNSNLIPFQLLQEKGIIHKIFNFGDIEDFKSKLTEDVKLVSTVFTSNLDGTSQPIEEMIRLAHKDKSLILVDGAQAVPHKEINVKKLDADFLVFSGHKMLGPSGTGVLYGKLHLLEELKPFLVGGDTVKNSTYTGYEPEDIPERFEAGLQNYAGIIGLAEAAEYLKKIGMKNIEKHEYKLNQYISGKLIDMGITLLGDTDPSKRGGIISFNIKGVHHHEVAGILNESSNIMIRSGMHCVHSWFNKHGLDGSARISLYLYNTKEECDILIEEIRKIKKFTE
ncbi:MAG: Cysteine desulfurase [Candidatus Woesearchaeota archaeon]|nr:Cysteine desulfurase [Candidatus Woesearchaeota archaeon]